LPHVDTVAAHRRSIGAQHPQCLAVMARCGGSIGMHDPMPGHGSAPRRHHLSDLSRATLANELGDVAVRHDATARNRLNNVKNTLSEWWHFNSSRSRHERRIARLSASRQPVVRRPVKRERQTDSGGT
jgi:hypothetical protein